MGGGIIRHKTGPEDRDVGKQGLDARKRFPPDEDFKLGERDCNFGLVVAVAELLWVSGVKFRGEVLVRVDLKWESFCDRQDLGR